MFYACTYVYNPVQHVLQGLRTICLLRNPLKLGICTCIATCQILPGCALSYWPLLFTRRICFWRSCLVYIHMHVCIVCTYVCMYVCILHACTCMNFVLLHSSCMKCRHLYVRFGVSKSFQLKVFFSCKFRYCETTLTNSIELRYNRDFYKVY